MTFPKNVRLLCVACGIVCVLASCCFSQNRPSRPIGEDGRGEYADPQKLLAALNDLYIGMSSEQAMGKLNEVLRSIPSRNVSMYDSGGFVYTVLVRNASLVAILRFRERSQRDDLERMKSGMTVNFGFSKLVKIEVYRADGSVVFKK